VNFLNISRNIPGQNFHECADADVHKMTIKMLETLKAQNITHQLKCE